MKALGKSIIHDGRAAAIIGVLPSGFLLQLPWPPWPGFEPQDVAAIQARHVEAPTGNQVQLLNVVGKVKQSVTIDQARAELETISGRVGRSNPAYPGSRMTVRVLPLSEKLSKDARLALQVLMAAVLIVLLMACANIARLLFGRGSARQKTRTDRRLRCRGILRGAADS